MKNIKRILSLIIVMALLLTMMAVPAVAKDSDTNETDIIGSLYLSATPTTITVRGATGSYSFRIDDSTTWTTNATFSGLYPNTEHTVYAKTGSAPEITVGKITTKASESHTDRALIDASAPNTLAYTGYTTAFSLENDLTFTLYLKASKYEGYENLRLYLEHKTYERGSDSFSWQSSIIKPEAGLTYYSGADRYVFKIRGLAAAQLGDDLCATLYADNSTDGKTYITPLFGSSMQVTAYNILTGSTDAAEKTLVADFINYCAAAQTYFAYNNKSLVNASLGANSSYATSTDPTLGRLNNTTKTLANAPVVFDGYNLDLGTKISWMIMFHVTDSSVDVSQLRLKLSYTSTLGNKVSLSIAPTGDGSTGSYFNINQIAAGDFSCPVTFSVYLGSTLVSDTRESSVENRARSLASSSAENKAMIYAMMKYSNSAKKYFGARK